MILNIVEVRRIWKDCDYGKSMSYISRMKSRDRTLMYGSIHINVFIMLNNRNYKCDYKCDII